MNNNPETEMRIVEAAIACIEKYGLGGATVRRIAQEASVNVAAINYYFRAKEQLMERVMEITLDNAFDWGHFESSRDYAPKPRLVAILDHMVAGEQEYPEITKAHFVAPMLDGSASPAAYSRFLEFMDKIYDDMVGRGLKPGIELRLALLQAVTSTMLGIGLHQKLCSDFTRQYVSEPAVRRQYIESIVNKLL
jgi:AcrR family transcriptional regulator